MHDRQRPQPLPLHQRQVTSCQSRVLAGFRRRHPLASLHVRQYGQEGDSRLVCWLLDANDSRADSESGTDCELAMEWTLTLWPVGLDRTVARTAPAISAEVSDGVICIAATIHLEDRAMPDNCYRFVGWHDRHPPTAEALRQVQHQSLVVHPGPLLGDIPRGVRHGA